MMSIEQKVNQHPESSAAGFELAIRNLRQQS